MAAVVRFDHTTFDAGVSTDPCHRVVRHGFPFTNVGTSPLEVLRVDGTCGCQPRKPAKTVYAPGEGGSIEVVFGLGLPGRVGTGSVSVTTNAGPEPQRLTITGGFDPKPFVSVAPTRLVLTGRRSAARAPVHFHVLHPAPDDGVACEATARNGFVRAAVTARKAYPLRSQLGYYRTAFDLEVFPSDAAGADFEDVLCARFSSATLDETAELPVEGRRLSDSPWELRPGKAIFVFSGEDAAPGAVRLLATGDGQGPADVGEIRNPFSGWLDASAAPRGGAGGRIEVVLTPRKPPPRPELDGSIEILLTADGAQAHALAVPVMVRTVP